MKPRYSDTTRKWAITTYRETRHRYPSRLACCQAIARAVQAHENTVVRWINESEGHPRTLTQEELPTRLRELESEVQRLQAANLLLAEQVRTR